MADPASKVIRDILVTAGIAQTTVISNDWFVMISKMPGAPNRAIAIFDTGGTDPHPSLLLDFQTVQVRVRTDQNGYIVGYQKCQDVKDKLLGYPSQTIGTERWVSVVIAGDIAYIARDDQDRPEWTINFRIIKEPAASTLSNRTPI